MTRDGARMPRESTRRTAQLGIFESDLDFEIRQHGLTVWVALLGIVTKPKMERLIRRVAPRLGRRGYRIVLDGRQLCHLDYRAVRPMLEWNRTLRYFDHRLMLSGWSDYLKAILVMEDWDRELGVESFRLPAWRSLSAPVAGRGR